MNIATYYRELVRAYTGNLYSRELLRPSTIWKPLSNTM